jgi:hypothetical protein
MTIPVDILCVILGHLDRADLAKICRLSKICCSYSQDVLYRDLYFPDILICHTLAQSTHLARRVRSFATSREHPELAKALRNMTCLRSLELLGNNNSSNILDGCIFSLDTFTCRFPYNESLLKFIRSQPSLKRALFLTNFSFPKLLDLEPTCLPNLTRITAPYTWLPQIVPGRPVSEIASTGYPLGRNLVDFSFYSLSTVPIQKLAVDYVLFPKSERLFASIFSSLTHLKVDLGVQLLSIQSSVRFSILSDNWILILHMCFRVLRNLSNILQISSLRCCRSECSRLDALLKMALLKKSVSHLSRKCPIGLPIWNSLPFLITNAVSGREHVGNGSFVSERNPPLGLIPLYGGDHVPSNACNT